jgi:hypothetical protein
MTVRGNEGLVSDASNVIEARQHRRGSGDRPAYYDEGLRRSHAPHAIKTIVSLNPIMVDGTGTRRLPGQDWQ